MAQSYALGQKMQPNLEEKIKPVVIKLFIAPGCCETLAFLTDSNATLA